MDALGNPVRMFITEGTIADCRKADDLITGFSAGHLLADRGYDSNSVIHRAIDLGMMPVIPPKKNRRVQREYDIALLTK